jgi:hypothetical protein
MLQASFTLSQFHTAPPRANTEWGTKGPDPKAPARKGVEARFMLLADQGGLPSYRNSGAEMNLVTLVVIASLLIASGSLTQEMAIGPGLCR